SLFWQLSDITPEAQQQLGVDGGILADFQPSDLRSPADKSAGKPAEYQFPHRSASSTKQVHETQYGGEVIVCDHWRAEVGESLKNADQHFRLVYLISLPDGDDTKITLALGDARIAVCHPEALTEAPR